MSSGGKPGAVHQIVSPDNPLVKALVRLHDRRGRETAGLVLLEGPHLLTEALQAGCPVNRVCFMAEWGEGAEGKKLLALARERGAALAELSERPMARAATTDTPPPVIATALLAVAGHPPARRHLGLVLDDLRDPGNLGTILRTAWGAGAGEVWATRGTVDFHAPKVLRAAQGAHFHLSLREFDREGLLTAVKQEGWWLVAALAKGGKPFWRAELRTPCLVSLGNEARGLGRDLLEAADERVSVPLTDGVDSLNVAVSAGVVLFELVRRMGGLDAP